MIKEINQDVDEVKEAGAIKRNLGRRQGTGVKKSTDALTLLSVARKELKQRIESQTKRLAMFLH